MELLERLFKVYDYAYEHNLVRNWAALASLAGYEKNSIYKAKSGDSKYLTETLVNNLERKVFGSVFVENNTQGAGAVYKGNSDALVNRFLDELKAQRELTQELVSQNSKLLDIISKSMSN